MPSCLLQCWTPYAVSHNLHSWRWAHKCPKHVELFMIINHNCCIKLVPLVQLRFQSSWDVTLCLLSGSQISRHTLAHTPPHILLHDADRTEIPRLFSVQLWCGLSPRNMSVHSFRCYLMLSLPISMYPFAGVPSCESGRCRGSRGTSQCWWGEWRILLCAF